MQLIDRSPVSLVVIIFFFLGSTWALLLPLPLLLPLLLAVALGPVMWKTFRGNPWLQQTEMPQALVWQIWGHGTEREGYPRGRK